MMRSERPTGGRPAQHHPDLNEGDKELGGPLQAAQQGLRGVERPRRNAANYDMYGDVGRTHAARRGFGDFASPFGDIFDIFFGRGRRESGWSAQRGSDLNYRLSLTLEEAFTGRGEDPGDPPPPPSARPAGAPGWRPASTWTSAPACGGEGRVNNSRRTALGTFTSTATCRRCGGTGGINSHPCEDCAGEGRLYVTESIDSEDTGRRGHGRPHARAPARARAACAAGRRETSSW